MNKLVTRLDNSVLFPMARSAVAGNIAALSELRGVLHTLSRAQYQYCPDTAVSSVGAHTRHIVDHYHCFFRDLSCGVVDYESRPKDPEIETRVSMGINTLHLCEQGLRDFKVSSCECSLSVFALVEVHGEAQKIETSAPRELLFLQSHTLHHMAIIGILLRRQGLNLPDTFGMSPSTIRSNGGLSDAGKKDINA